jgi:hypothetical protein
MYDSVVAITINKTLPHCSGVIIAPNLIMTAGHCVDPLLHNKLYITYGCDDIREITCTHIPVIMAVPHPGHKESGPVWNDISLIKPLTDITNIKPSELAIGFKTDSIIYMAGFGRRPGEPGGILYSGTSKINYSWLYEFETYLNGINGPCAGDSGSPAFDNNGKVIGILSRSYRNMITNCGGIARYTVPIMHIDWINQISKILGGAHVMGEIEIEQMQLYRNWKPL